MHAGHMRCQFPSSPTTPKRVCRLSTDFRGALREIRRKDRRSLFHFAKPTPQRPVRQAFRNSPGIAVSIAEGVDWDPVALTDGKQGAASFQSAALRLKERRSLVRSLKNGELKPRLFLDPTRNFWRFQSRLFVHLAVVELRFFNPYAEIRFTANRLPHWQQDGAAYFVTFRLADAVPYNLRTRWESEREAWLRVHPQPWSAKLEREYHERFSGAIERWLDAGLWFLRSAATGLRKDRRRSAVPLRRRTVSSHFVCSNAEPCPRFIRSKR